ncbi:MAG TPA: hypothetical protein GXZ23_04255, partial [Clostridiales bacterium]|nr:hypothetical protein [Clostridiales bacterium]
VYTLPINVAVDMSNAGVMSGNNVIDETIIIKLHLFDECKHAHGTIVKDGNTVCRVCGNAH